MKMFKKIAAALLSLAMVLSVVVSSISVSAAGISAQMLNANQRLFYDALVQKYVTEFNYGGSTSFSFWFRGEGGINFDTTEGEVTTEELFVAAAMFVADYSAYLPWLDMEGQVMEEYPVPFVAASVDPVLFGDDEDPENDMVLNLAIVMFSVKEEYAGDTGDLFGYPNITIKDLPVDNSNSPNKALGASVTAESTALDEGGNPRSDLAPELAVDGDINTRWQAQTTPSTDTPTWIALDLGEEKSFDRVRAYWETARPTFDGYSVQISDDGNTWTDIAIESRGRTGDASPYFDNIILENKVTTRYVRLYITVSEKLASSAWEIELYDGEPDAPPATLTSIEITKAPDKTVYSAGTFPIPDLTGMELTLHYSDNSNEKLNDEQLKELQGFGSLDVVAAAVDEATSTLCIQYKGFETSTPVTVNDDNPVSEISVSTEPTGVGLQGLVITTNDNQTVEIAEDGYTTFAIDLMGVAVNIYVVEYNDAKYLLMGMSSTDEETGEESTVISFMGASAELDYAVELQPVPDEIPGGGDDNQGGNNQGGNNNQGGSNTGVESVMLWAVVAMAAMAVVFVTRKVRA